MSRRGESAHSSEIMTSSSAHAEERVAFSAAECPPEQLEWQTELDSAMEDIDYRLEHPRRRATDRAARPTVAQLSQVDLTSELLDEIAWRVAEQVRRAQSQTAAAAAAAPEVARVSSGAAMTIRIRKPLFRFRFWRRRVREESLLSFADSRVR